MYVTNSKIGKNGRLGNQLFQYSMLRAISINTGKKLYLGDINNQQIKGQMCLLPNFKFYSKEREYKSINFIEYNEKYEDCSVYNKDLINLTGNIDYNGYFQSYKYFDKIKNILIDDFKIINVDVINKTNNIMKNIKEKFKNMKLVAIHVRGGDKSKCISNSWWNLNETYLKKSLSHFGDDVVYLIFNTQVEKNINNILYNIIPENRRFFIQNDVLTDFNLMKHCDHFILTNSTLGWMAAYLSNINTNKKVIHPHTIFENENDPRNKLDDYIPNNWIIVK